MEFDYKLLGSLVTIMAFWGGIFLAAAKSIFITKQEFTNLMKEIKKNTDDFDRKLYDSHNIPLYVLRSEWITSKAERDRKYDLSHHTLLQKIDEMMKFLENMRNDSIDTKLSLARLQVVMGEKERERD